MSPELHKRAGEIFELALDVAPQNVVVYLDEACQGDPALRAHVESMLRAERQIPGDFLAKPAMHAAAQAIAAQSSNEVATGTIFGNYRAGKQIGAGGMGTVYEALDLRLNRPVALKILPQLFGGDHDRVRRFEQEARAASLLNHPNIVSIYDANFDTSTGLHYIAIEFVQGETLRELARRAAGGALECKELVDIATQIASALSAAHQALIVHRDIKPENIMVRPDGIAKVLDFGLAKLLDEANPGGPPVSQTRYGAIAGTIHYLSPEQVMGRPLGPRSDLFSLGVVLYELATGVRPFQGPTDGAIFESILHTSPEPPAKIKPGIPDGLDRVILRLLEKDVELRFQTAGDLRSALKLLDRDSRTSHAPTESVSSPPALASTARRSWILPAAASALATAASLLLLWRMIPVAPDSHSRQPLAFERLTSDANEEIFPNLSADGSQFAYASAKSGNWDIYLQRTGGQTPINLTKDFPEKDSEPAISPDGQRIAFRSERDGGGIFVMEVTGENPRRVAGHGFYPAWSPDGKRLVACEADFSNPSRMRSVKGQLFVIDAEKGTERVLAKPDFGAQPSWSPDGRRIAYWGLPGASGQRDIFTVASDGRAAPVAVTADAPIDWNPVWSPDGRQLYFLSDRGGTMNIWRINVDPSSGAAQGEPQPVTAPALYVKHFSLAANGSSFVFVRAEQRVAAYASALNPATHDFAAPPLPLGDAATSIAGFSLSPDETKLVFDNLGDPQEDLWIMNADGSGRRRLTHDLFKDRDPSWSPDGKEIVFYSDRESKGYDIWAIRADGSGLRRLTRFDPPKAAMGPAFSHDGKRVLAFPLHGLPLSLDANARSATAAANLPGLEQMIDGYLVATNPPRDAGESDSWLGQSGFGDGNAIFRYRMRTGQVEQTGASGRIPVWLPGQKQFLFLRQDKILLFDLASRKERILHSATPNEIWNLRVSRDGLRVIFSVTLREGDIWLGRFAKPPA